MWIQVLGATRVTGPDSRTTTVDAVPAAGAAPGTDETPTDVDLGARKPRAILAALALHPGRSLSPDTLADLVWNGEPPRAVHGALHSYVSGLRTALRGIDPGSGRGSVIETTDHGYRLAVEPGQVDAQEFARRVRAHTGRLAPLVAQLTGGPAETWPTRADVTAAVDGLDTALALWQGEPYADLPDHLDVLAERSALARVRAAAHEARVLGLLALGDTATALAWTEGETALQPTAERLWSLHALALYRSGRQAQALDALRTLRQVSVEELGLDPGPEARGLEAAMLRQDEGLLTTLVPDRPKAAEPPPAPTPPAPATDPTSGPVGRASERARLAALLDDARAGRARFASLVGEAGIGKSVLLEDVVRRARDHGFAVGAGRCSQDDGAPPLWPWLGVLGGLGSAYRSVGELTGDGTGDPGQVGFATSERILAALLVAAESRPVLVVLDDLHWADGATLRALAHVVATLPETAPVAVVVSRRGHPEPTGPLALVAGELARRHATRLDLAGLHASEAGELLATVLGHPATADEVEGWHERSGGNPFYLVELARLGASDQAPGPEVVPAGVLDVVRSRLVDLPTSSVEVLRAAAVMGRRFHPELVAEVADRSLDAVTDDLERARALGLVAERAEAYDFVHALTRDAVLASLPASRRARLHARAGQVVAASETSAAMLSDDERIAETARHWLAAGPAYADRAWPAARDAADQARTLGARAEATRLRREAVTALGRARTSESGREDRYELLVDLARDAALAAIWPEVLAASTEAVSLARALGDAEGVARAAAGIAAYSVWTPYEWGEVMADVIEDLRWAASELPTTDSPARCRALLALAVQLYYDVDATHERQALVLAGLDMARRLGDPALFSWAARAARLALWTPVHTAELAVVCAEGLAAAEAADEPVDEALALIGLAALRLELGDLEAWTDLSQRAVALATRHRLPYVIVCAQLVELTLDAMRARPDAVAAGAEAYEEVSRSMEVVGPDIDHGPALLTQVWGGRLDELAAFVAALETVDPAGWPLIVQVLTRAGQREALARRLEHAADLCQVESWAQLWDLCVTAEAAFATGHTHLAARVLPMLAPYAGRMCVAGVSVAAGPVDGYLALAAAAVGDLGAAERHADQGLRLAEAWGLTAYVTWLEDARRTGGF